MTSPEEGFPEQPNDLVSGSMDNTVETGIDIGALPKSKREEIVKAGIDGSYNAFEATGFIIGLDDNIIENSSGQKYSRELFIDSLKHALDNNDSNYVTSFGGLREKFFRVVTDDNGNKIMHKRAITPNTEDLSKIVRNDNGKVEEVVLSDEMQLRGYLRAKELQGLNTAEAAKAIDEVEGLYRGGRILDAKLEQYLKISRAVPREIISTVADIIAGNAKQSVEQGGGRSLLGLGKHFAAHENPDLITEVPSFETPKSYDEVEAERKETDRSEEIAKLESDLEDPKFNELNVLLNNKARYLADKVAAQKHGDGQGSIRFGRYAGEEQMEIDKRYPKLDEEYRKIRSQIFKLRK